MDLSEAVVLITDSSAAATRRKLSPADTSKESVAERTEPEGSSSGDAKTEGKATAKRKTRRNTTESVEGQDEKAASDIDAEKHKLPVSRRDSHEKRVKDETGGETEKKTDGGVRGRRGKLSMDIEKLVEGIVVGMEEEKEQEDEDEEAEEEEEEKDVKMDMTNPPEVKSEADDKAAKGECIRCHILYSFK